MQSACEYAYWQLFMAGSRASLALNFPDVTILQQLLFFSKLNCLKGLIFL